MKRGQWGYVAIIGVVVIALILFSLFTIVNAGERGVLLQFGKPIGTMDEGINFKIPIIQSVAKMNIRTLKFEADAEAASRDLQDVNAKVALNYHLDATKVIDLYREVGPNDIIESTIIAPALQESVKASTAQYDATQLVTERAIVKAQIEKSLENRLLSRGIFVETLSITDFKFSPAYTTAIEAKQVAQQQAEQAQNILDKTKIDAESVIAQANGTAQARLTIAKAEAQAIQIQGEALRTNPEVVQLRTVEKWNGVLPLVSGQMPMILNLPQLNAVATQAADNSTIVGLVG